MGEDPYARALGRAIRVLRTDRGLERKDLAAAAGLSYPYLAEIEGGKKRPSTRALEAIARALGTRPHQLLAQAEARLGAEPPELAAFAPAPPAPLAFQLPPPPPGDRLRAELEAALGRLGPEDLRLVLELVRRLAG